MKEPQKPGQEEPERPFYYSVFIGQGHELLADELDVADAFALPATEIVERVLAAGYTPDVRSVRRAALPTPTR